MNTPDVLTTPDMIRDIARAELRLALADVPTLETLRPLISQMVQERWVSNAYPVMNSLDLTTRSIETSLGQIYSRISDINGTLGTIKARMDTFEERLGGVEEAVNHPERGLAATRAQVEALRNTIHGNPEERSGIPSLFEMIEEQNQDRQQKHAEQMAATSGLVRRVEDVETWIKRRQAVEGRILEISKKVASTGWSVLHDWRFWLAALGTGAAIVTAILAGQQPQNTPDIFDLLR